jgi:tetratricopeptide (TPR) repeat protein/TolB-like protein
MTPDRWETLSGWLNAWLAADPAGRDELRARLAAEHPDLVAEADGLTTASGQLRGFLEIPALVLEARELAHDTQILAAGSMVGPYRVSSLLARGGMGDVYRATDERLRRDVALKVLAESKTGDPRRVERFMHEARVTASLTHPNIVRVYDVGVADDRAYLVAELLEGETLRTRIERGAVPADETMRIGLEIARGLVAAHAAGLVHRDLKPDNIFLTRSGATKILDFGIAKLAQDETVQDGFSTLTGVVLGTAGYLSPEQIKGEAVDARADLFALGAVLFEMLTGTRAFAREHLVETLHAILHDMPTDALGERGDVPPALVDIVLRLLDKSPAARFQSAAELIDALDRVELRAAPAVTVRTRPGRKAAPATARRSRVRRVRWAAVGSVSALLAAYALWLAWPPSAPTLAIVPFQTIPTTGDNEMLEVGLAGEFISRLSRVADLSVLPLTATVRLRSESDPLEAARRLGATHILTGTLQREGNMLQASVLLQTSDRRTVLSLPVPTDRSRVFEIQDFIVTRVLDQLVPQLANADRSQLAQAGTRNSAAYEAYVQGRAIVLNPTSTNLVKAADLFNAAVRLDPDYADAWAGLGSAYKRMPPAAVNVPDALPRAREAANNALRIQPEHPEGLSVLGTVAFWYDWKYDEAERLLRRALSLQPSFPDAQLFLAHLLSNLGRHDEALEEIRLARAFDPEWPLARALQGQFLWMARRHQEAVDHLDAMIRIAPPDFWTGHMMRIYPLLALGRYDEAIRGCDEVIALRQREEGLKFFDFAEAQKGYALARMGRPADAAAVLQQLRGRGAPPILEAFLLLGLRHYDDALEGFRKAVELRYFYVTFFGVAPQFDELREMPAFRELLKTVNLLEVSEKTRRGK